MDATAALPSHPAPPGAAAALAAPVASVQVASGPSPDAAGTSASSVVGPIAAALLLAALAVAALVLGRRRRRMPRLVEVLEAASLGPRRSLVVVRMGDDVLLLGASEGGVSLLATRPAGELIRDAPPEAAPAPAAPRRARDAAAGPFDALLAESAEDAELRRKLATGLAGNVR